VSTSPATTSVSVTLNGDDQVATFSVTSTVTATTNAGWNLTAWAPAPTGTPGALAALTVTAQSTPTCGSGTCTVSVPTAAITGISWPLALGTTAGTATKFWNAALNTGNNKNQFVATVFGVPVRASAFPGTYTTTLTVAVATGP
jgi:hypothetical protein